jgi:valyl-tRNA synthetase
MRSRVAAATETATRQLDGFDLAGYAATVYELAWSDYCDWFLEMAKVDLRRDDATDAERAATWHAAATELTRILRLLHPLMPFVTEEIWSAMRDVVPDATAGEELLVRAAWPVATERDPEAERAFEDLAALVRGVRNLRTEAGTEAAAWVPLVVDPVDEGADRALRASERYVSVLARARPIERHAGGPRPDLVAASPLGAAWLGVDAAAAAAGAERRAAQLAELERNIDRVRALLANDAFIGRAPAVVVERERARLADLERERRQLGAAE